MSVMGGSKEIFSLNHIYSSTVGDVVAQWLVHQTWDLKVKGLSPGWCTNVVFLLSKTLNSYSASLHPGE